MTTSNAPGASARREDDRRRANDEQRLRAKWGRFGGVAVALSDERSSTKAWERGAVGEERVAAILAKLDPARVALLHDRRIPGGRANIDHIAVTAAGIWVIDAKRYAGRPQLKVSGGLFRPRVQKLYVGSRDCTRLVDGVLDQVAANASRNGWRARASGAMFRRLRLGCVGWTDRDQRCKCDHPAPSETSAVEAGRGPIARGSNGQRDRRASPGGIDSRSLMFFSTRAGSLLF